MIAFSWISKLGKQEPLLLSHASTVFVSMKTSMLSRKYLRNKRGQAVSNSASQKEGMWYNGRMLRSEV